MDLRDKALEIHRWLCRADRNRRGDNLARHLLEQKAPRIQAVLRVIQAERGALNLNFLGDLTVEEARAWLEHLLGIVPKTSVAVLSVSSLRRPALPVDGHHHSDALRTGLIPASLAVGPSHRVLAAQLPPDWDAQQIYDNHDVLMRHGPRCCLHRQPACTRYPLLDLCPTGKDLRGGEIIAHQYGVP